MRAVSSEIVEVILCAASPGERRLALLRDGVLREYHVYRPGGPDGLGALHWARVIAAVPAMEGAFVTLADGDAFLPDSHGAAGLSVGTHLAVSVVRAAQGGKGARVTARLGPADAALGVAGPVRLLRAGPSPLQDWRALWPAAQLVEAPFGEVLAAEIEALGQPGIALPGGMSGTVTPTPALTAIDLDIGTGTAARDAKERAQFAANRDALPELARQIALRNLSGAILVDFAGMAVRRRAALREPLAEALAADRLRPQLQGFTGLGFAEILRPRRRPPLHEMLTGPHAAGLAALRQAVAEARAAPLRRMALRAAPPVIRALEEDSVALVELARVTTHPLMLRSDPALPGLAWTLEDSHG